MIKKKAIHYINQFYAGYGGENKADMAFIALDELKGPGVGLSPLWADELEIVKTFVAGDNFINVDENFEQVKEEIRSLIESVKPDVFIAGPAFNAGRYGVACAKVCDYVKNELGIPSVTAMWHENPAVDMYVRNNYIVATPETAAGMRHALPSLAALALKLAKNEKIGPARIEGYFPTGHRYNEYHEKTGAKRVVEMLINKLYQRPFHSEVPLRKLEMINPTPKISDLTQATVALITTGGLVPKGNPDKLKQAFATSFGRYSMIGTEALESNHYESIHGGYDTTAASADPHRLVPLDQALELKKEGKFGEVYEYFFTTCGVGTNIESSKQIGAGIGHELKAAGVRAAILTTT